MMSGLEATIQGRRGRRVLAAAGLAAVLLGLAACGPGPDPDRMVEAPPPDPGAAYQGPPQPMGARLEAGRLVLSGQARPDGRVRVIMIPDPAPIWTTADGTGAFSASLPPGTGPRLLALAMEIPVSGQAARMVQAEGYVFVAPDGRAALLRAGAGARVLARPDGGIQILALDYDRAGGVVISGLAPAGTALNTQVDGVSRGRSAADTQGRYAIALEPLGPGQHRFEVAGGGRMATASLQISPAAALSQPYRAEPAGAGWRIDWMTPGGGLQSTLVLPAAGVGPGR